ncbi:Uma2 family endonuclease [Anaerolineales bacterium HSG24]|nr:Uma2 family endonuclease [Anaerolineales bacterium HSG24]
MTIITKTGSAIREVPQTIVGFDKFKAPEEPEDRFQYGWRYVCRTLPSGKTVHERIPLTLYDILHPEIGDFQVHSRDHERFCNYLEYVFSAQLRDNPTAIVLQDVRVAWAASGVDPHGPDVSVIFGVKADKNWSTFNEMKEGTKPSLIVEVTSPKTRNVDLENKYTEYAQAGVTYYLIVDTPKPNDLHSRRVLGYELKGTSYVALPSNNQGWFWLPPLHIWLGLQGTNVCCYDSNGQAIGDYTTMTIDRNHAKAEAIEAKAEAVEAKAKAKAEAQARQDAEAKNAEMVARLQQLEAELHRWRDESSTNS